MKVYFVWLKTELKRVAQRLPSLFIGAIVLALLAGTVAFCAFTVMQLRGENQEFGAKVALVCPEDELTNLAIQFVMGMESLEDWCSFEKCSLEEGLEALRRREVVAVIELPEDVINSILDGSNIPAKLYLPQGEELGSSLIQIMAKVGVSLLQVAQGEIYATTDLYKEYPFNQSLGELYGEINLYNLNIALNRENLFKSISLSETEGISLGAYYGGTAISVFVLLFGLLMADLMVEHTKREHLLHISRITISAQLMGRFKILTLVSFLMTFAVEIAFALWMNANLKGIGDILTWCGRNSLDLLLAVACIVALSLLLGTLMKEKMTYMFATGFGMLLLGYIGGYYVPSSLLGEQIKGLSRWLPTTYVHDICSGMIVGQDIGNEVLKQRGYVCLFTWLTTSLILCVFLRKRRCAG